MQVLNAKAAELIRPFEPNAVTDVTGFGLLGHAFEMASRSGVSIELHATRLPALAGALELAAAGVRTGGDSRNREYVGRGGRRSTARRTRRSPWPTIPQTAGGLLVSVPADRSAALEQAALEQGCSSRPSAPSAPAMESASPPRSVAVSKPQLTGILLVGGESLASARRRPWPRSTA